MEVIVRPISPLERRIRVRIDSSEMNQKVEADVRNITANAHLKGFRKGKVPPDLIKQRYGSSILTDVRRKACSDSFEDVISKENLDLVHLANFEVLSDQADSDLSYVVDIVVKPKLNIDDLDKLNIIHPVVKVSDSDLDKIVDRYTKMFDEFVEIHDVVQADDRVSVVITDLGSECLDDKGNPLENSLQFESKNAFLFMDNAIDEHRFLDFFIQSELLGHRKGEEVVIERTITDEDIRSAIKEFGTQAVDNDTEEDPDSEVDEETNADLDVDPDSDAEEAKSDGSLPLPATTNLNLKIRIEEVRSRKTAELNEEFFAREDIQFANEPELRESLKESSERESQNLVDNMVREQIFRQLMDVNPVDIPRSMLEERARQAHENRERHNPSALELEDRGNYSPSDEEIDQERTQLLMGALVDQYVKANEIQLDTNRMNEELSREYAYASMMKQNTDYLFSERYQNATRQSVLTQQVFEHIAERIDKQDLEVEYDGLNDEGLIKQIQETQPDGGPFSWTSPVTDEEIDAANEGEREIEEQRMVAERAAQVSDLESDVEEDTSTEKVNWITRLKNRWSKK